MEVLALIAQGQPNKGIARALGIAERTAKLHVTALLDAVGARNRTHLLVRARASRAAVVRLPRRLVAWLQNQEAEQLDPLFRFTPMVATMSTVAAVILVMTLRGDALLVVATLWLVTFTAVSLACIVGARRYLRLRPPRERLPVWALWAFGSTLLHVLLLASVSIIWMPPRVPKPSR